MRTFKIKDLNGDELDYAVAMYIARFKEVRVYDWRGKGGILQIMVSRRKDSSFWYNPSRSWSKTGEIKEEFGITSGPAADGTFVAYNSKYSLTSNTELEAILKCALTTVLESDEVSVFEVLAGSHHAHP